MSHPRADAVEKPASDLAARAARWLPGAALALFPLILFAELLLTGKVLFWGLPALQFNPWRMAAFESLRAGVLPWWNQWNGMGAPLLANYQLALFYPPSWMLYLFAAIGGAPALAWGHTLLVVVHLAWAGWGTARLLARLGTGRLAQTVGGLAFGLCGFLVARSGVFPMVWSAAWLPWIILAASAIAMPGGSGRGRPALPAGLIACVALQLLAGHAQLAWYSLLLAAAWVITGGLQQGLRGALLAALRFGICCLLAAALASPQLGPTAEFLSLSQRSSAVDYELGMQYSFWPWRFLAFFAPDFFGTPADGSYWGYAAYWEDAAYLGMLPLLLALGTLRQVWRRGIGLDDSQEYAYSQYQRLVRFLWTVIAVSMLLALGKNTPVFPFLYRYIPTFDMFQAPTRYLLLTEFSLALLAGLAVEGWRKPSGARLRWLKRGAVAAFAITLGAGAGALLLRDVEVTFIRASALAGLGALLSALLTLRMPPRESAGRRARWEWLVILFVGADLVIAGWGLRAGASADLFGESAPNQALQSQLQGQRVYLSASDEYLIKFWRFFRFKDYRALEDWQHLRAVLPPNLNILDQIAVVGNFDPLVTDGYARWTAYLETLTPEARLPWLRMMGVGAVEEINVDAPRGVEFTPVERAFRWYWSNCASFVSEPDAFFAETARLVAESAAQPQDRLPAVVLYQPPYGTDWCNPADTGRIKLVEETPNRLALQVTAPSAGWLVVSDSYYPGWKVTVDGRSENVLQANDLFRAVVVPAGQHMVIFTYSPGGFSALLAISTAGWLALAGWTFFLHRSTRKRQT